MFEKGRDTREITPMFKFTVICNKLPGIPDPNDGGIWVRARVIPFESRFVSPGEPVPSTYEEQLKAKRFPQDPRIKKQIPGMAQAFAWYLLEHRKKIKGTMVVEPEKVMQATNEYKRQSDTYRQFEEEKLEMEDEKTVPIKQQNIISLTEIYNCFKDWFRDGLQIILFHQRMMSRNILQLIGVNQNNFQEIVGEVIRFVMNFIITTTVRMMMMKTISIWARLQISPTLWVKIEHESIN